MPFCNSCGNFLVDGVKFCNSCGTPVGGTPNSATPPPPTYNPNNGNPNPNPNPTPAAAGFDFNGIINKVLDNSRMAYMIMSGLILVFYLFPLFADSGYEVNGFQLLFGEKIEIWGITAMKIQNVPAALLYLVAPALILWKTYKNKINNDFQFKLAVGGAAAHVLVQILASITAMTIHSDLVEASDLGKTGAMDAQFFYYVGYVVWAAMIFVAYKRKNLPQ